MIFHFLKRFKLTKNRNLNLNHINLTLREQLDQATIANQKLSQEIQKVNHEWIRLREQLETREREWREEENSFNDYFGQEHAKLLNLWRTVVSFRRSFSEMKPSILKENQYHSILLKT